MGLVGGVVALNVVLAAVGYCLLAVALRGRRPGAWVTFAGIALLVGAAAVGVAFCILLPLGVRLSLGAFAAVAVLLCAGGLALAAGSPLVRSKLQLPPGPHAGWPRTLGGDLLATTAGFGVVAILVIAVVGGFRSSPWLDDTWYFWLPKGRALDVVGLDPRLWHPNPSLHMVFGHDYESLWFIRPDNPLWWSILLDLDVRFVGAVDLRAVNGELALLLVAFAASVARLFWGHVRASALLPVLFVVIAAPEFLRQAQGGDADVPLAIYLALALVAAVGWLALRNGFALALFGVLAAAAIEIKSEGILEFVLYLAVLSAAAWRRRAALPALWGCAGAAVATAAPWYLWRAWNGVPNVFSVRNALSPSYLADHTALLHAGLRILGHHFTSVREWSLIVPLTVILGLAAVARRRSPVFLAPAAFVAAGYVLFVWVSWADPEGAFRLVASAYRYVTPPIVLAGAFLPLLAEASLPTSRPPPQARGK
jgi:hypothetical protein